MNDFLRNNRFFVPILHVSVWIVLFSLPYLLSTGQTFVFDHILERLWIPLVFYAVVFYLNYFLLIDNLLLKQKAMAYVLVNAVVIAGFIWLKFEIRDWFPGDNPDPKHQPPPLRFFIYFDSLSLIVPVLFAVGLRIFERWIRSESERKETENARLVSELQHLKYQLQPHFFFNSLNNIYSLVDISPDKAKETIHSLGILMRYLLYDTNVETVSLKKEVEFMQKYIALMDLRTSGKTVVHADFPIVSDDIRIAPLLFISLIENAFKHGVSATQHSELFFSLRLESGKVIFESTNGNFQKNEADRSGSGIGLQNLRKRLELLYPNSHRFKYGGDLEHFTTRLEIRLR